jgi:tRNA(Ile)-lysidine synthase
MLSGFTQYIKEKKLPGINEKLLLAISGGLDSVVMAQLFHQAGYQFGIAHCNFNLRANESDEDEAFVKQLSEKYRVPIFIKQFNTNAFAKEKKISIQMAARQLRYDWFEKLIELEGYQAYATAHHLDDQIETFFINALRGTGISGLHGILPRQGNLIHPLLFAYRKDIQKFAQEYKLSYREDSSNEKTDYTRNKIRHDLVKMIKTINPAYQNTINENINRIQQTEEIFHQKIREVEAQVVHRSHRVTRIDINKLVSIHPLETYLYEFLKSFGFNFSDVKDIIGTLNGISGKQFLSKSHRLIKDREYLLIEKREQPKKLKHEIFSIPGKDGNMLEPIPLKMEKFEKNASLIIPSNPQIASLDFDKLNFPLTIRKWKRGDYFFPLGMKHKKLISDFFSDNKFSIIEKEQTYLLTSEENIVWIIGYRIDNRFKITPKTKMVFQIEYLPSLNGS